MNVQNNFIKGRMNKSLDERLIPNGEYVDALNVEVSSVEGTNIGSVKNAKGNTQLTTLEYNGAPLSASAVCIGAVQNESTETVYWFVHSQVDGVDMVVSYNSVIGALTYHIISTTVLNFNPEYLITGVNIIDDLLLWTDNYNQPRKINVNRHYPFPVAGVDQISEADIALIVAPPIQAPTIAMKTVGNFTDYIVDKFVSFAYRYKYQDGEYSALSQFSDAAFTPGGFYLNEDLYVNDGMSNVYNAADVSFDTGGSNVVGVDLCFKLNDSNIINVIEKFDKLEQGWPDNSTQTIEFGAKKIYTTLPESELLRVYDNVPRLAKAQTIMGNRATFGNYVDGYDIIDASNQPIEIDYTLEATSNTIPAPDAIDDTFSFDNAIYDPGFVTPPTGPFNNVVTLDFGAVTIQQGDNLVIELELEGIECYNGAGTPQPGSVNDRPFSFSRAIKVDANYANASALAASASFLNDIGTVGNIQPIATCCSGATLSDMFACSATPVLNTTVPFAKNGYGFSATNQPIDVNSTTADTIDFTIPVMQFWDNVGGGPSAYLYQYYRIVSVKVSYVKSHGNKSLHSNRGYEIGIIYMDAFGRNSTTVVCDTNSVFLPPSSSVNRNSIRAYINNLPPAWATRYKFAIKPSKGAYNIVYSNEHYTSTEGVWFKLDGQNQLTPTIGSKLIVKADSTGALTTAVMVEVLDVQSQPASFIGSAPAGLYMLINDSSFVSGATTDLVVFETDPDEVNDQIYYEGSQSFAIIGGYHQGNVLNQGAVQPAISDLSFFNCYTFGNGVEGYKYLDGVTSRALALGNRFSAVAEEDYSEAHRFATLTYSGVYNADTNVNKLNEFNLALANYKDLEKSFASIQKLHGRQTDILVLQEDKISYVLAGKNLLSDAAAGGAITSVPEVLGTQIARLEEYGVSQNPESFASFGRDKFFTDATRGAVLKLTGSSYNSETLEVVSEYGMGSWFRDEFNNAPRSQKLGGYDPYLDEYVLSIKADDAVEWAPVIVPCGTFIDSSIGEDEVTEFTLALGEATGSFNLIWTIGLIGGTLDFQVIYNGVTTSSGAVSTSGSMVVSKPTAFPTEATVRIISVGAGAQYQLEITCP